MCLAVPAQIVTRLDGERAVVDLRGSRLEVSTVFTPQVDVADWVLLHTGFTIECLSPEAAARLLGEYRTWDAIDPDIATARRENEAEASP